ncbi:SRPBCC domain-containing protein [Paracrocinitomix mangrovi]|uniref:SRPBCC domain-containing protein n=1 Tax=Paracrocinitomix mangrovi TaxID=2862509 RepID=UPI001C8E3046|nr:SRPBCC domain-containing protein [Paracrocinitomix mangrovi]UKN01207.1 SRPBCC domain-containing protein [Paracrocinitomix mangrovi]
MDTTHLSTYVIEDNEITYTRLFNAPIHLVWEAWSKVELREKWFGPNGFTITTFQHQFSQGGIWKFTMHGPDGTDFPNKIEFVKINEPTLIMYKHVDDEDTEAISFQVEVKLKEMNDSTELTMRHIFRSAEELRRVAEEYGAIEGGQQTLARLADLIE